VEKRLREEFGKLQVEINDEKSRIVDLERGESFGFLTSATSAVDAERGGRTTRPSSKSGRRWCGSSKRVSLIPVATDRTGDEPDQSGTGMGELLRGWAL
jgi:RNA-directed DNA polymerase